MRAFLIRRNSISLAICGIAAVLMFYVVNYPAAVDASASARQLPIYCVQRDQKLVSISFDAAWGNEDTQELIDILDRCSATSFLRNWDSILEKKRANLRSISEPARLRQPPPPEARERHTQEGGIKAYGRSDE